MKSICVFCGSNKGQNPIYSDQTIALGKLLAAKGITLVYGAGSVGLMGILADTMLENDATVIGVIPDFLLKKEVGHMGLTELHVSETMHQRKQKMADLSDGFMVLPGGTGTMDEFFEIFTWGQLALHQKPFGILNINGYYDGLIQFINTMVKERFLSESNQSMLHIDSDPEELLKKMNAYTPPSEDKWLDLAKT